MRNNRRDGIAAAPRCLVLPVVLPSRSLLRVLLLLTTTSLLPLVVQASGSNSNNNKIQGECIPYENDLSRYHCHRPTSNNKTTTTSTSSSNNNNYGDMQSPTCEDEDERCEDWAEQGECRANPNFMLLHCSKSCKSCVSAHAGATQIVGPQMEHNARAVLDAIVSTEAYLRQEIVHKVQYLQTCLNRHELCTAWAVQGQCESGDKVEYMQGQCAPACKTCHRVEVGS